MIEKLKYILTAREKRNVVLILFMVIIGSFLELAGVSIFMPFINVIMDMDSIHQTPYLNYFYNLLGFCEETDFIVAIAGLIILVYILKNVYLGIEKNIIYKYSYKIQIKLPSKQKKIWSRDKIEKV